METTLYEVDPGTDYEWQRPEVMSDRLGISKRTVRNMVSRGELERMITNGRVWVRRSPTVQQRPEPIGRDRNAGIPEPDPESETEALSELLKVQLALVTRQVDGLSEQVQQLNERLLTAKVEAERNDSIADAAIRDLEREREQHERSTAELDRQRKAIGRKLHQEREQHRAALVAERELLDLERNRAEQLAAVAALPWWRVGTRKRMLAELAGLPTTKAITKESTRELPPPVQLVAAEG